MDGKRYRHLLPDDVIPLAYDLFLEPDLQNFLYSGTVIVDVRVDVATEVVMMHANQLLVSEIYFQPEASSALVGASSISMSRREMTVTAMFDEPLPVGLGKITVHFQGELNDQMKGFYRSQYKRLDGSTTHLATTHFEPIDARRCFPHWDEPARKATFKISLTIAKGLSAYSCMPEARVTMHADGKRKIEYLPTPKMSSYIIAFCVGEFDFLQGQSANGTLVRVICCPGKVAQCSYALNCAIQALDYYNEYFGIPYPLPKMDLAAIPDFPIGAMENWGLLTYRESLLLCEEESASTERKQRICSIIAHEISHMWFGNLVTMVWWDDLWLKEGFASWMQVFCSDKLFPHWAVWQAYVGTQQQQALLLDSMRSSHPIQVPIARAEESEEVFDAISYAKGGATVRMARALLGEESFRKGLQLYFERHKYRNTETSDLWNALEAVSGKPVAEIMDSWTKKMGFPMVRVLSADLSNGEIEVEQRWYLSDGSEKEGDVENLWIVPMLFATDRGIVEDVTLLRERVQKLKIPVGASWVKLNAGQHVLCRVLYPPELFFRLADALPKLLVEDRIGLLTDAFAFCKSGQLGVAQLVELLRGFAAETNDKAWEALDTVLKGLDSSLARGLPEDAYSGFRAFAAALVAPIAKEVGWSARPGDDDNSRRLRQILLGLLANFCSSDLSVIEVAKEVAENFFAGGVVSADVRVSALSLSLQNDSSFFERLIAAHDACDDAKIRNDIYVALASAPSAELQRRAMDWTLTDAVRAQDMSMVSMGIAPRAPVVVMRWVREQYGEICRRITGGSILFQSIVRISGVGFASEEEAEALETFWKNQEVYSSIKKTLGQVLEGVRTRSKFVARISNSDMIKADFWETLSLDKQSSRGPT